MFVAANPAPEVVGQLMHVSGLNDIEHHPNRRWIASASAEMIILWESTTGKSIRVFPSFSSDWTSLAFSPDGRYLAAGNLDHRIYLWDLNQKKEPKTLEFHELPVRDLAFHPKGWLLSAAAEIDTFGEVIGEIIAVDPHDGQLIHRIPRKLGALQPLAFTPDGKRFIAGSLYHSAVIWDSETFQPLVTMPGNDLLRKVAVHPADHTVAVAIESMDWLPPEAGDEEAPDAEDGRYRLQRLNLSDLTVIHHFQGYGRCITDLRWSPKGDHLYASIADNREKRSKPVTTVATKRSPAGTQKIDTKKTLRETGKLLGRLSKNKWVQKKVGNRKVAGLIGLGLFAKLETLKEGAIYPGREIPQDKFFSMSLLPLFPTRKGGIRRWTADGTHCLQITYGKPVFSLTLSADGAYLVADGTKGTLEIWDTRNKALVKSMRGATRKVEAAVFSPDGQSIAAIYGGKSFFLWHLDGRVKLRLLRGHTRRVTSLAFSPDGQNLLSGSVDGTIRIWDAKTGDHRNTLEQHKQPVVSLAFSKDGTKLISSGAARLRTGNSNGKILVWDLLNPKKKPENLAPRAVNPLNSPWHTYQSVAFAGDNLVIANQQRTYLALGEEETGTIIQSLDEDGPVYILATGERPVQTLIDAAGKQIFTLTYKNRDLFGAFNRNHGEVTCWTLPEGDFIGRLEGLKTEIIAMALRPDGRVLVTSDTQGDVVFWDTETRQALHRKRLHAHALQFAPAGDQLLLLKPDGQMEFWDADLKQQQFAAVGIVNTDEYIITTPDHFYTASGRGTDAVAIVEGGKAHSFEQFDLTLNQPAKVLAVTSPNNTALRDDYQRAYQRRRRIMGFETPALATTRLPTATINNKQKLALSTDQATVTLSVKGADTNGLARLHVKVNDVPLYGRRGLTLKGQKSLLKQVPITLAYGLNKIQVAVRAVEGNLSRLDTVFIKREGTPPRPNLYMLLIGVNEYRHNPNLTYAVKDAGDMLALFQETTLFEKVHHRLLTNQQVDRETLDQTRAFLEQATVNDQILVFLSGHGLLDPKTFDYYYATHDADPDQPSLRGYSIDMLEHLLDQLNCRRKLVMLDTCYSGDRDPEDIGTLVKKLPIGKVTGKNVYTVRSNPKIARADTYALMRQNFVDLRRNSGSVILASSSGREISIEGETWQNGVFTFATFTGINSGLADVNEDQFIQVSELVDYLALMVPQLSQGMQTPTLRQINLYDDFAIADTTESPKRKPLTQKLKTYLTKNNPFRLKDLKAGSSNEAKMFTNIHRWTHKLLTPTPLDYPKREQTPATPSPENQNHFFTLGSRFVKLGAKENATQIAARQKTLEQTAKEPAAPDQPQPLKSVAMVYQWTRHSEKQAPLFVEVGFEPRSFEQLKEHLVSRSYEHLGDVQTKFAQETKRTMILDEQQLTVDGKAVHYLITKSYFTRKEHLEDVIDKFQKSFLELAQRQQEKREQRRRSAALADQPAKSERDAVSKAKPQEEPVKTQTAAKNPPKGSKWKLPKLRLPKVNLKLSVTMPKKENKEKEATSSQQETPHAGNKTLEPAKEKASWLKKKIAQLRRRKKAEPKPPQFLEQCTRVFYHYVYRKNDQWVVFSFPAGDFQMAGEFDGTHYQYSFDYDAGYENEIRGLFDNISLH